MNDQVTFSARVPDVYESEFACLELGVEGIRMSPEQAEQLAWEILRLAAVARQRWRQPTRAPSAREIELFVAGVALEGSGCSDEYAAERIVRHDERVRQYRAAMGGR